MPSRSSDGEHVAGDERGEQRQHQLPANDSTTSAPAQPVACIQRPKRVSAGSVPCPLTIDDRDAPARSSTRGSARRTRHWASSLTSSKRKPRATGTRPGGRRRRWGSNRRGHRLLHSGCSVRARNAASSGETTGRELAHRDARLNEPRHQFVEGGQQRAHHERVAGPGRVPASSTTADPARLRGDPRARRRWSEVTSR